MKPAAPVVHPLARAVPEMLRDEYVELVADIKANGLRQPVVLFDGKILDGRHRARACAELGIAPTTVVFDGNAVAAAAFVLSSNVHRRHLTLAQKQTIVAAELKRDPAQSNVAIAKTARVSDKTVAKARAAAVGRSEIPNVATRTDSVGRSQPAAKPNRRAPVTLEAIATAVPVAAPPTLDEIARTNRETYALANRLFGELGLERFRLFESFCHGIVVNETANARRARAAERKAAKAAAQTAEQSARDAIRARATAQVFTRAASEFAAVPVSGSQHDDGSEHGPVH